MKNILLSSLLPFTFLYTPMNVNAQTAGSAVTSAEDKAPDVIILDVSKLPQPVWHHYIMPGQTIRISAKSGVRVEIDSQVVGDVWTAPLQAGTSQLEAVDSAGETVAEVTIFTLEPSTSIDKRGYIGKYRIGTYPRDTPKGFIKLEENEVGLRVSKHFKVGQFLCKQQPGTWPKYVLVTSNNLVRLEALLEELNRTDNIEADTFFVMSGFRTPFYNSAIGSAKFSRHMYGDAADIYVDTKPRNGTMDDLNGDGKITKADANYLYDYAAKLFKDKKLTKGGIGSYKANAVHGPFVHVDARGRAARWGR